MKVLTPHQSGAAQKRATASRASADSSRTRWPAFGNSAAAADGSSPTHAEITMTYGQMGNVKAGPPARFVYQSWTTMQHQLTFEFKDLPLP